MANLYKKVVPARLENELVAMGWQFGDMAQAGSGQVQTSASTIVRK